MSTWNKRNFSVYNSDEKSALGLIDELGKQTNYNSVEIELAKENLNKKVSYDDMTNKYKLDQNANFTGSWFGIKKPTGSNEGLAATVDKIVDEDLPKINEELNKLKTVIYDIRDYGAKCDGITDDTQALKNALLSIPEYSSLGIYGNCLINSDVTIEGCNNKRIIVNGILSVMQSIEFIKCNNFKILNYGKVNGYGLKYATILGIDNATKKVTVDNSKVFMYEKNVNVIAPKTFGVGEGKYFGTVNNIIENDVYLTDNPILENFSALQIGDKLYSSYTSTISFNYCNNIDVVGYFEPTINFLTCNNIYTDVKMQYGSLTFDFSYNITVIADCYFSGFYGLFAKGCRLINIIKFRSKYAFFTAMCFKSCWEVNQGMIHIENPCLMAMQIIKNTITNPSIPYDNNSNCQNSLTCNGVNINNLILIGNRQGVRINGYSYNININNIYSDNCYGNQLIIQDGNYTLDNINVNNIIITNHEQNNNTKYNSSIPVYVERARNVNIENVVINNSKGKSPLKVNSSKNVNIGKIHLDNVSGLLDFSTIDYLNIKEIENINSSTSSYLLQLVNLNNATIDKIKCVNDYVSRGVVGSGYLNNITINDFTMEHTTRTSGTKGIYFSLTSGKNITISNYRLINITDNLTLQNIDTLNVSNGIIKGGYNSIVTSGTTNNVVITANNIESSNNISSSALNKYTEGNLFKGI